MKFFWMVDIKLNEYFSVYALVVFKWQVFACFFEITFYFLKILPVTLSKELVAAFRNPPLLQNFLQNPAVILRIVP
jgi:hypothetical protein